MSNNNKIIFILRRMGMLGNLLGVAFFIAFLYLILKFLGLGLRIFWFLLKILIVVYIILKLLALIMLL